jgi:hypothetical protein
MPYVTLAIPRHRASWHPDSPQYQRHKVYLATRKNQCTLIDFCHSRPNSLFEQFPDFGKVGHSPVLSPDVRSRFGRAKVNGLPSICQVAVRITGLDVS